MKKHFSFLLLLSTLLFFSTVQAQNTSPYWSLAGNSNANAASILGTMNNNPLRLYANSSLRAVIATNGYFGIGTATPQQRLHVEGSSNQAIFVSTSAPGPISGSGQIGYVKALPTAAGNRLGYFLLGSRGGGESNYNVAGMVGYAGGAWSGSSRPAYLTFETTAPGNTSRAERVRITPNGFVGIGTPDPTSTLDVTHPEAFDIIKSTSTFFGLSDHYGLNTRSVNNPGYGVGVYSTGGWRGVIGVAESSDYNGDGIGLLGEASGTTQGQRYGVYGTALGGASAYGVVGIASDGASFNAAGYFSGDLYANGVQVTSDRKFKEGIAPIQHSLEQVMKLKPSVYQFKTEVYKGMHLSKEKQLGLIADEVKVVFPELVKKAVKPAEYDKKSRYIISPEVEYETVNYLGLTPVLIASIQELKTENDKQQQFIEKQQQQIEDLMLLVSKLTNGNNGNAALSGVSLLQNAPNPVNGSTAVRYSLPEGAGRAQLLLTDALGRSIKAIQLTSAGVVNVDVSGLSSGVYNYSLVIDGKTVQTKKMTVTKL